MTIKEGYKQMVEGRCCAACIFCCEEPMDNMRCFTCFPTSNRPAFKVLDYDAYYIKTIEGQNRRNKLYIEVLEERNKRLKAKNEELLNALHKQSQRALKGDK